MLDTSSPDIVSPAGTVRTDAVERSAVIDQVAAELARSGMRIDRFVSLASEGLLLDDDLKDLWRQHRDILLPDWAA